MVYAWKGKLMIVSILRVHMNDNRQQGYGFIKLWQGFIIPYCQLHFITSISVDCIVNLFVILRYDPYLFYVS